MLSQQFKTFLIVAETGSFTKAANRLFNTPASVMNQINALENRLNLTLLKRTNHGIKLTPAGKLLAEKGHLLIHFADTSLAQARKLANPEFIELKIGTSFLFPANFLLKLWQPFKSQHSEYKFSIVPYQDDQASLLGIVDELGERVDILVGCFEANDIHGKAEYLILGEHQLCIGVPNQHPLAKKEKLIIQDLYGEHVVMEQLGKVGPIDKFQNWLIAEHPQIFIEHTDSHYDLDTFNDCVRNNHLLLSLGIWTDIHPSLTTIPLDTEYKIPYGLLVAKKPSHSVRNFLSIVKNRLLQ